METAGNSIVLLLERDMFETVQSRGDVPVLDLGRGLRVEAV